MQLKNQWLCMTTSSLELTESNKKQLKSVLMRTEIKDRLAFSVDFNGGCVFNITEGFDSLCKLSTDYTDVRSNFSIRSFVFQEKKNTVLFYRLSFFYGFRWIVNVWRGIRVTFMGDIAESWERTVNSSILTVASFFFFLKPKLL